MDELERDAWLDVLAHDARFGRGVDAVDVQALIAEIRRFTKRIPELERRIVEGDEEMIRRVCAPLNGRVEELERGLAEANAEFGHASTIMTRALERAERLEAALRRYGQHAGRCILMDFERWRAAGRPDDVACDCGLDDARAALADAPAEENRDRELLRRVLEAGSPERFGSTTEEFDALWEEIRTYLRVTDWRAAHTDTPAATAREEG